MEFFLALFRLGSFQKTHTKQTMWEALVFTPPLFRSEWFLYTSGSFVAPLGLESFAKIRSSGAGLGICLLRYILFFPRPQVHLRTLQGSQLWIFVLCWNLEVSNGIISSDAAIPQRNFNSSLSTLGSEQQPLTKVRPQQTNVGKAGGRQATSAVSVSNLL